MNIIFLESNPSRTKQIRSKIKTVKFVDDSQALELALSKEDSWNFVFLGDDIENAVNRIIKNQPCIRNIIVHTMDHTEGHYAVHLLKEAQYKASYVPFNIMIGNLEKFYG